MADPNKTPPRPLPLPLPSIPTTTTTTTTAPIYGNPTTPFRGSHHRRSQSDFAFRTVPDDFDITVDPFAAARETSLEEDDLFSTYMDMDKIGFKIEDCESEERIESGDGAAAGKSEINRSVRARHRHCNSMDGSMMGKGRDGVFGELIEAKKAMPPDKLAELAAIDPKKAKRCVVFPLCELNLF